MGRPLHHHTGVAAFSEQVVISEYSAVRLEPGLPWEVAALFGCAEAVDFLHRVGVDLAAIDAVVEQLMKKNRRGFVGLWV